MTSEPNKVPADLNHSADTEETPRRALEISWGLRRRETMAKLRNHGN